MEQVAINALASFHPRPNRWESTGEHLPRSGYPLQLYEVEWYKGLQPKRRRSWTSHYFPKGRTNTGVIIDIDASDVAICDLGSNDVLTTHGLENCAGMALHMQRIQKRYLGLKTKPIPGTDIFLLTHLTSPPLGINEILKSTMKDHAILGVAISADYQALPFVEAALNSWRLRIKGFNPKLVAIDSISENGYGNRGMVITREGGAFLRPKDYEKRNSRYKMSQNWRWGI